MCSIKFHSFWRQNFFRSLLTLETFPSLSSALETNPEIAMLVFGASPSIWRAKLTMASAVNRGSLEFTSLVPTWIMIFSGSFLRMGLIKSCMSSAVAPGNGFTTTLLVLERLQPRMFWIIESPAITVTGFLVCALFPRPDCSSLTFFSGFLSLVLFFFLILFGASNLPFFLVTLIGLRTIHVVRFQYSL